jgi:Xylose isomerase-like TIM barrel.
MRLCFDATRFGSGLDGAIELAVSRALPCVEYSFSPFSASGKGATEVKGKELKYLESLAQLAKDSNVEIACLNLDYEHAPGDKKSAAKLVGMLTKLSEVASILGCQRLSFYLTPGQDNTWKDKFETEYKEIGPLLQSRNVRPLLRLATPGSTRGVSLKKWRAMEPQDWRDLLSVCPGLSLSFSPGDCVWLGIDYLAILSGVASAIEHVEANDVEINRSMLQDSGMFGPLWWRYRQIGKGSVDWGQLIEALKLYDYQGTFSIHLDDEFLDGDVTVLEHALDDGIRKIKPLLRG